MEHPGANDARLDGIIREINTYFTYASARVGTYRFMALYDRFDALGQHLGGAFEANRARRTERESSVPGYLAAHRQIERFCEQIRSILRMYEEGAEGEALDQLQSERAFFLLTLFVGIRDEIFAEDAKLNP